MSQFFWESEVLELSPSLSEFGVFNLEVVGALALAWFICCLTVTKGVKSAGHAAWLLSMFPYSGFLITVAVTPFYWVSCKKNW